MEKLLVFWDKLSTTKRWLFVVALVVVGILIALITVFSVLSYTDSLISAKEMHLTNITDTGVTIVWTSEDAYVGKIYYQEANKPWRPLLSQAGQDGAYDDRDIEINQDGEYAIVSGGARKRHTHHVTLRDLKPDTKYNFRIGGVINGKEGDISEFTTLPLVEGLRSPDPGYGLVVGIEEGDAIILIGLKKPSETNASLVSAPLARGTYSVDMNVFNLEEYDGSDFVAYIYTGKDKVAPYQFQLTTYKPFEKLTLGKNDKSSAAPGLIKGVMAQTVGRGASCDANTKCIEKSESGTSNTQCWAGSAGADGKVDCRCRSGKVVQDVPVVNGVADATNLCAQATSPSGGGSENPPAGGENIGNNTPLTCDPNPCSVLGPNFGNECGNANKTDNAVWCERNDHSIVGGFSGICYKKGDDIGTPAANAGCRDARNVQRYASNGNLLVAAVNLNQTPSGDELSATGQGNNNEDEILSKISQCGYGWDAGVNSLVVNVTPASNNSMRVKNAFNSPTIKVCKSDAPDGSVNYFIGCGSEEDGTAPSTPAPVFDIPTNSYKCDPSSPSPGVQNTSFPSCNDVRPRFRNKIPIPNYRNPLELSTNTTGVCNDSTGLHVYCTNPQLSVVFNRGGEVTCGGQSIDVPVSPPADIGQSEDLSVGRGTSQCDPSMTVSANVIQMEQGYANTQRRSQLNADKVFWCANQSFKVLLTCGVFTEQTVDDQSYFTPRGNYRRPTQRADGTYYCVDSRITTSQNQNNLLNQTQAQSVAPPGPSVLGAADDSLEVIESGRYVFFQNNEIIAEQDVVLVDDKAELKLFTDLNNDGVKDANEKYFEDYSQIKISKQASAENFSLNSGWNLISLPLIDNRSDNPVRTAGDLIDYWNKQGADIKHVARFKGGQFNIFSKRESGSEYSTDFNLISGQGLFILNLGSNREVTFSGNKFEESIPLTLNQGWNLVGVVSPKNNYNSEQLLTKIGTQNITVSTVSQFENGKYQSVVKDDGTFFGNNFNIVDKRGYFIKVEEGGGGEFTP